jgi:hypothetical protein
MKRFFFGIVILLLITFLYQVTDSVAKENVNFDTMYEQLNSLSVLSGTKVDNGEYLKYLNAISGSNEKDLLTMVNEFKSLVGQFKSTMQAGEFKQQGEWTNLSVFMNHLWELMSTISWVVAYLAWSGNPSPFNVTAAISMYPILPPLCPIVFDILFPLGEVLGDFPRVEFPTMDVINNMIKSGKNVVFADIRSGTEYETLHIVDSIKLPEVSIGSKARNGELPDAHIVIMDT